MDEQKMIEEFLDSNSFYCETYKARITKIQCEYNSGRTMYNMIMYQRKLKQIEDNPSRWGNLENLFYTQLFIGKMTCKDCDKFTEIDDTKQEWLNKLQSKSDFFNRVAPNDDEDTVSACSSLGG